MRNLGRQIEQWRRFFFLQTSTSVFENLGQPLDLRSLTHDFCILGSVSNGIKSQDYGQWSKSFIFSLDNPKNVGLKLGTQIASDQMEISWDEVLGADLYQVSEALFFQESVGNSMYI